MVIITRIIGVLLMVSLLASCNEKKKETDKNTSEINYQRIEMITGVKQDHHAIQHMKDYGKDYKMKTNMMVYRRRGISFEKMMQKNSSQIKNINSLQALQ